MQHRPTLALATIAALASACGASEAPPDTPGARLAIGVAALNLQGVGDVVWDLEVRNGASPTQVVWQRRISSSSYGDGAGSASYVGPCDADPATSTNTVRVWVVGVYSAAVTSAGAFASGDPSGVVAPVGSALPFEDPTATSPLSRTVACLPDGDVPVQFDVALMRPAQQGFFDIAVSFSDIYCSAKLDCCDDADGTPGCDTDGDEDITLLFDAGGQRASTFVLGFACTAGPRADVETELYMDAVELDCTSPTPTTFAADVRIDPSGPAGNQCTPGPDGMTPCAAITQTGAFDADTALYQVGLYRGEEQLTSGGVAARKIYWNVALGVKRPAITSCQLRARATAHDANRPGLVDDGEIAAGVVYPYVQWDAPLGACTAEPLTFGDAAATVRPVYTGTTGAALPFTFGYGPSFGPGSFCPAPCQNGGQCVLGTCDCPAGYDGAACENDIDECASDPCGQGGACNDGVNGFTCTCWPAWTGPLCATATADLVVSANTTLDLTRARLNAAAGSTSLTITPAFGTFAVGDLVMLHQTRSAAGFAGLYEFARVTAVSGPGTTLTVSAPLAFDYATTPATNFEIAQVVKVPEFQNITVQSGRTLSGPAFEGTTGTGGILLLSAAGTITVAGTIDMSAKGFRGIALQSVYNQAGDSGEGTLAYGSIQTAANGNGGGGGGRTGCECCWGGAGGGGGHGTAGGNGSAVVCHVGGTGGLAVGNPAQTLIFFGGAGGQGGADEDGWGSAGANGGGIVYLMGTSLSVTGAIRSNGQAGAQEYNVSGCGSGGGGGGAGGAIYLDVASATVGTNLVTATGGGGGDHPSNCGVPGGQGAVGRITAAGTLSGTTSPSAYVLP